MAQVDEGHGALIAAQQQVYETLRGELDKALARYRAALRGRMPAAWPRQQCGPQPHAMETGRWLRM